MVNGCLENNMARFGLSMPKNPCEDYTFDKIYDLEYC